MKIDNGLHRNHPSSADHIGNPCHTIVRLLTLVLVSVGLAACSGVPTQKANLSFEPVNTISDMAVPPTRVAATIKLTATKSATPEQSPSETSSFSGIVFQSDRSGNFEIFRMAPNGSGVTRLTNNPAIDSNPSLSPDGTRIAFSTFRDGPFSEIYSMNSDGTDKLNLTKTPNSHDYDPAWSPDGSKLVFKSERDRDDGGFEIYVMDADGTDPQQITRDGGYAWAPSWSPDGSQIAYSMFRVNIPGEIYLIDVDNWDQTRLTDNDASDGVVSWSPDGNSLLFESDISGDREIYLMQTDGRGWIELTNNPAEDIQATWSPDGNEIVFQSNRDGNFEIYRMNANGSEVQRITNHPGHDGSPSWGQ